jgi:Zn-dependent peptidase ImmA (M78 family)/ribosome-binding protein aMBF1 (putative translation factor)
MIKNERQLKITKSQLEKFKKHLSLIESLDPAKKTRLIKFEEEAVREQIRLFEIEIDEYQSLWASKKTIPILESIERIPQALIEARLSLGLSQKDLADRVGLKEQQIQRYEATEFETASFARIKELIKALDLKTSEKIRLLDEHLTYGDLFNRLKEIGLDKELLYNRILPPQISAHLQEINKDTVIDSRGMEAIDYLSSIYPLTPDKILSSQPVELNLAGLGNVRFKLRKRFKENFTTAYTYYAHYLALLVLQASRDLPIEKLPTDPYEIRKNIVDRFGSLTLKNAIRYVWSLGVPVISLNDAGAFQGAFFQEKERGIILLNSRTKSHARWQFDLFHEFWHASLHQSRRGNQIIEIEDFSDLKPSSVSKEEQEASLFAGAILLGKSPDKLVRMCLKEADHDLVKLKQAVKKIARIENVPIDVLANCVAFRLSQEGHDWWGAAENLQEQKTDIPEIVKDTLLEYVNLDTISQLDLELLTRALDYSDNLGVKA